MLTANVRLHYNSVMKRCGRCQHWLPFDAFTPNTSRRDGLQAFCKECHPAYMRAHYEANREYYLAKARRSNARRYELFRNKLWELKSGPCQDCGVRYSPWVMRFDHVRGDAFQRQHSMEQIARRVAQRSCKM